MDMREIVEKGYESGDYAEQYRKDDSLDKEDRKYLEILIKLLPKGARILDLGCGVGIPHDKFLIKQGFKVVGVDISKKHIDAAKKNNPEAEYIHGDFSRLTLKENSFDAIISLYAIFHIPREEHEGILNKINKLLKKDGIILITLGAEEMKMDVHDFVGANMAWSSFSAEENKELVKNAGFEIIHAEVEITDEKHLWILAKNI